METSSLRDTFLSFLAALVLTMGLARALVDPDFNPSSFGTVRCLAVQPDGKILVASDDFSFPSNRRLSRLHVNGSVDSSFYSVPGGINGAVRSLAVQADGKILIGGSFSAVNGISRSRIARLHADGSVDSSFYSLPNGINGTVRSLVMEADGKILIAGDFTIVGGSARNRMARLNASGSLDSNFDPDVNGTVSCLAVQSDGKILIGGDFTSVDGVVRNRIARLDASGGLDLDFDPNASSSVTCVAVQSDGKILVGGYFGKMGGISRICMARLRANGGLDERFYPYPSGPPLSLALQADGKILLAGEFSNVDGQMRNRLARLDVDGNVDMFFNPQFPWSVQCLALQTDGKVLVGGDFVSRLINDWESQTLSVMQSTSVIWWRSGSVPEVSQVTFDLWNGSSWVTLGAAYRFSGGWLKDQLSLPAGSWIRATGTTVGGQNNSSSGRVEQIAPYGTFPRISIEQPEGGGLADGTATLDFGSQDWLTAGAPKILTIRNIGSGNLTNLAVSLDGSGSASFAVGALGTTTLAPGASTTLTVTFVPRGGGARTAALHISSNDFEATPFDIHLVGTGIQQDAAFNPDADNWIESIALQADGKILIGGRFTSLDGTARSYLARLHADGSLDTSFVPLVNGWVSHLAVQTDGKILVRGNFSTINGMPCNYLARLNSDGSLDPSFHPAVSDWLDGLALQSDGKILVIARVSYTENPRHRVERLNPDGSPDASFNSGAATGSSFYHLAVQADGRILVGGNFASVGGVSRRNLARLNSDGTMDPTFVPVPDTVSIGSLALQPDGKILIAGEVLIVNFQGTYGIRRLNADGSIDNSFTADGYSGDILALQADGKILMGGTGTSVNGMPGPGLLRLNPDGERDNHFDADADDYVRSAAIQDDGKIVVGGLFTSMGGVPRNRIARLPNDITAVQILEVPDPARIRWLRGGSAPELDQVTFERWDGSGWVALGNGSRIAGGFQLTGLNFAATGRIRACGRASDGYRGNSSLIDQVITYNLTGIELTSLENWRLQYFGSHEDGGDGADFNDFDQDGMSNLMEYALGMVPIDAASATWPVVGVETISGQDYLTLTVTKPASSEGVAYRVEVSDNLGQWFGDAAHCTVLLDNTTTLRGRSNVPIASKARGFIRLKVTRP